VFGARLWCSAVAEPDFLSSTRAAYDVVARDYAEHFRAELASKPLDRALFAGFAELVRDAGVGAVLDVGCGPGRLTDYLHRLGLMVFGVDLSSEMVAVARRTYPNIRFDVGSMLALDLPDGTLGGVVANYSIIHVPCEQLPEVFAEFYRVLASGGYVLLVFQVGDERLQLTEAFGHPIALNFYRRPPDRVAKLLRQAGLDPRVQMVREPDEGVEKTQQAYLLAYKPERGTQTK